MTSLSNLLKQWPVIFLALSSAPALAERIIDTVAGGSMPNGVPASGVELISTGGITGDSQGNVYFVDSRYVIRRIRADGAIETVAGNGISRVTGDGGPATAASLIAPTKLTSDSGGNLFLLDGSRIRRIDSSGQITTVAGTGIYGSFGADGPANLAQINPPGDLAACSDGTVFFTETNENRVRKLTPDGRIVIVAGAPQPTGTPLLSDGDGGPSSAAHLNRPSAIACDQSGNVYVAEANSVFPGVQSDAKIRRIAPDGTISTFASGFTFIRALAPGGQGTLYVGECSSISGAVCQIRRVGPDGTVDNVAGGPSSVPSSDGQATAVRLGLITGIFADSTGNIYMAETNPSRIRRVTPQSMVETIAGGAPVHAPDGSDARQAWLVGPTSIAADHSGNLYIAESCMIRKVTPGGEFTTVAGTGRCSVTAREGPVETTDLPYLYDLAVDSQGQVYASDQTGSLLSITAGKTVALVSGIKGVKRLVVDTQDRLYASAPPTLVRMKAGAAPETFAGPNGTGAAVILALGSNSVITTDPADNVYVAFASTGSGAETVYRLTPDGRLSVHSTLRISPPLDSISVDAAGKVYGTNQGLVGFDYYGTGFAGDGGPLASAQMNLPLRLVAAPSGGFYFLDANNRRVRKITGAPPAAQPAFSAASVVNAASGIASAVAPGELISIYGTNLGPVDGWVNDPENNRYPAVVGHTKVLLDPGGSEGSPIPILQATDTRIDAFVSYDVSVVKTISLRVRVDGVLSEPVTLNVAASAFGLFTSDGSGSGQGRISNQDGSENSAANPAERGSIVSLYGTGDGLQTPRTSAGTLVLSTPYPASDAPVTVTIGGKPAEVLSAGAAPSLAAGIAQIKVQIPQGVTPGDAPIVVSIGGVSTTKVVTVAVK